MHNNFNLSFRDQSDGHVSEEFECAACHMIYFSIAEAREHCLSRRLQTRRLSWKPSTEAFFDLRQFRRENSFSGGSDRSSKVSAGTPASRSSQSRSHHSNFSAKTHPKARRPDTTPLTEREEEDLLSDNLSLDLVPAPGGLGSRYSNSYGTNNDQLYADGDSGPKTSQSLTTKTTTTTVTTIRTQGQHSIVRKCREEVFAPAIYHKACSLGLQRVSSCNKLPMNMEFVSSAIRPAHRQARRLRASTLVDSSRPAAAGHYEYTNHQRSPSPKPSLEFLGRKRWDQSDTQFANHSSTNSSSPSMTGQHWKELDAQTRRAVYSRSSRRTSGALEAPRPRECIYDDFNCGLQKEREHCWSTERSRATRAMDISQIQKRSSPHHCKAWAAQCALD